MIISPSLSVYHSVGHGQLRCEAEMAKSAGVKMCLQRRVDQKRLTAMPAGKKKM